MNIRHTISCLHLLLFICLTSTLWSQKNGVTAHNSFSEKIYLQLDKEVYSNDETIWFKAILTDAVSHYSSILSGVLYVELINDSKEIKQTKTIKIANGIGSGAIGLNEIYKDGKYLIRAYTEWNKNFDNELNFKKYITIFSKEKNKSVLEVNDKNKNESNNIKRTTQLNYNSQNLDLQFFPESGSLVHGLNSKVGFKAINSNGKGEIVSGKIIDENNDFIREFKSNELGMGSFLLNNIDSSKAYYAMLDNQNQKGNIKIKLPKVSATGNILQVKRSINDILVELSSNYLTSQKVTIEISSRGYIFEEFEGFMEDGKFNVKVQSINLPDGIIVIKAKDTSGNTMLERFFFNYREDKRINLELIVNKNLYTKREKTSIKIKNKTLLRDDENISTSIAVVSKDALGSNYKKQENILSYFLINSDLKGYIENPGFYFNEGTEEDLDALLLTQGWTNYNYTDEIRRIKYQPEFNLTVKGVVNYKNNNKDKREIELILFPLGLKNKTSVFTTTTKVPGHFNFEIGDLYGDLHQNKIQAIIQDIDKVDKEDSKYIFGVSERKVPEVKFDATTTIENFDIILQEIINKGFKRKEIEENYLLSMRGTVILDEVIINSSKRIPKRNSFTEKYGLPDVVISEEELQEKKRPSSRGLFSDLMFGFPDKITITRRFSGKSLVASAVGNYKGGITFVAVDGIFIVDFNYNLIEELPTEEVIQFDVIENISSNAFKDAYRYSNKGILPKPPYFGSIVSIYTRTGKGLFPALKRTNTIDKKEIPVFSLSKQFYAPRYDFKMSDAEKNIPDMRTLLHWNPDVNFDGNGEAVLDLYNSDVSGEFLIILETISTKGKIGYERINYTVENKNMKLK